MRPLVRFLYQWVFADDDMKKGYCFRKEYHWIKKEYHAFTVSEYIQTMSHTIIFFQLNENSIDSFNRNFKKLWEHVANQVSNKA